MILQAFSLSGKRALVTGSASGLGRAIAVALAEAGADVACHGRTAGAVTETLSEVRSNGRKAFEVFGDLSDPDVPERLMDETIAELGGVDILINNAGTIRRSAAAEHSEEDWNAVIGVNLSGVFRLAKAAGKTMIAQGSGKIVNIASLLSFQGGVTVPSYTASKSAVAGLTRALANEWAPLGINVNAIAPGYIATKNTEALRENETRNRQILERIPAGRWGDPKDVCGAAVFLSSAASEYMHGHILVVDGGWMAR